MNSNRTILILIIFVIAVLLASVCFPYIVGNNNVKLEEMKDRDIGEQIREVD